MFRIGQKIRVLSHSGYEKFEGSGTSYNAPKIGERYVIEDITNFMGTQILWLKDNEKGSHTRGLYAIDAEPATKLERALK